MSRDLNKKDIESVVLKDDPRNEIIWAHGLTEILNQNDWFNYIYKGRYDPVTNTPDLTSEELNIKKNWVYAVMSKGVFLGLKLKEGDLMVAEEDNPKENWRIIKKDI